MPVQPCTPDEVDVYYPAELEAAEAALIRARRAAIPQTNPLPPPPAGAAATTEPEHAPRPPRTTRAAALPAATIGMGLSGGGIRSATFCLGLFQALARAGRLGEVDMLSTVSGGGYFGAFLGRLFTRDWVSGVADVERILQTADPLTAPPHPGWGARVFRWLRDNGRYLAPRGSGDLLLLGAIVLRNWIAVQVVLVTTVLAAFLALQIGRTGLESVFNLTTASSGIGNLLVCNFPGGNSLLWWSPWVLVALVPLIGIAVPAGWAYWLVVRRREGQRGVSPTLGLLIALALGLAGSLYYGQRNDLGFEWIWVPAFLPVPAALHDARLLLSGTVFVTASLALLLWIALEIIARRDDLGEDTGGQLRNWLSGILKLGLMLTGVIAGWAVIDSLGGTLYDLARAEQRSLSHWAAGIFTAFAGLGAFARQLAMLLAPTKTGGRRGIPVSVVAWVGAVVALTIWLVAINVASHAIAWDFGAPRSAPSGMTRAAALTVLGADHLVVAPAGGGYEVRAAVGPDAMCAAPPVQRPASRFRYAVLAILFGFTFLFGHTLTFANLSTIHTFYAARLTRTFLGASNPQRLSRRSSRVKDSVRYDDCSSGAYWNWPAISNDAAAPPQKAVPVGPCAKGGPLHIVNTTVNETLDARTGIQNQDRKGTGLAIGPCGLSLGIRHHLATTLSGVKAFPDETSGHCVFRVADGSRTPDTLSLGKWISVSGAAFSAAAGANTSVPMALLAGLFNVRLGYWWDSGTPYNDRWMERLLPVQTALFQEMLARTHGTAGRRWNLSDGGHFENMGGYELIRRRLPIMVIVDAEADPDYTFDGLSDLVRKARLDFNVEITFFNQQQLSGDGAASGPPLPDSVRPYFGNLEALRRGTWTDEELPYPPAPKNKRYRIAVDRSRPSRAHAALARVHYADGYCAWLVYVKATLMGDEPEDVCHYHRAHPEFPQETTTDQFFDEKQWESYRRLGVHISHRVLTKELFDHLRTHPA